ncbi:MAG: sulfatase [Limisphaerales bacterium]
MNRLNHALGLLLASVCLLVTHPCEGVSAKPNILILMADDWGWPASPLYGDKVVKTPALERIARDGVLFNRAYCNAPSCAPSRAALFTGQNFWRLEEGANLLGTLPAKFPVYNDLLKKAGYVIGSLGKGYSPANLAAGGRTENPSGPRAGKQGFDGFLKNLPADQPFCFWFGSTDPHRPYKKGSGVKAGIDPAKVQVPGFLPDVPEVRSDFCDYYLMVQKFNDDAMKALAALEKSGRYDNTLIIITGDNGAPFPHGKTQVYEWGVHQPLAICWKGRVPGGRTVDDYTCFTDFAPTILEAAGLSVPLEMTGKSLLPVLLSGKSGQVDLQRDAVFVGLERHVGSYPMRAIRTKGFAYIRNFAVDRDPNNYSRRGGPSMDYMIAHKDDNAQLRRLYAASFGPRPTEELYDLQRDPDELTNLASDPKFSDIKRKMSGRLMAYLAETKDPRALGNGEVFDNYRTWDAKGNELPVVSKQKARADVE